MRTKLSRRDFLKVTGAGVAGAALFGAAGCGGGQAGGGGDNTLEFWAFDEGRANLARAALKTDEWKQSHGNVNVNFSIF